jgi:hypothetical protein
VCTALQWRCNVVFILAWAGCSWIGAASEVSSREGVAVSDVDKRYGSGYLPTANLDGIFGSGDGKEIVEGILIK